MRRVTTKEGVFTLFQKYFDGNVESELTDFGRTMRIFVPYVPSMLYHAASSKLNIGVYASGERVMVVVSEPYK